MAETKQTTREEFIQEFEELSKRTGWTVAALPRWIATNHGSYEMVIEIVPTRRPEARGADNG